MYWQAAANAERIPVSGLSRLAMTILIIGIIWLGVYPSTVLNALKSKDRPVMLSAGEQTLNR